MVSRRAIGIFAKVMIPILLIAVVAGGIVAYARAGLMTVSAQTRQIVDSEARRLNLVLGLRVEIGELSVSARDLVLEMRAAQMDACKLRFDQSRGRAEALLKQLLALPGTDEQRVANERIRTGFERYVAVLDRANVQALKNFKATARDLLFAEEFPLRAELDALVRTQVQVLETDLRTVGDRSGHAVDEAVVTLVAVAGLGLLAAVGIAVLVVRLGVTGPLWSLVGVLARMAQGEVAIAIPQAVRGDEIGAVGRAVEGIRQMLAQKAAAEAEAERRAADALEAERRRGMIELANAFEETVGGIVGVVSSAAAELQTTAAVLTTTTAEAAAQSIAVAAAAEQASGNVQRVASAAEVLGASIAAIGRQISGSASLARSTAEEAGETTQAMQALHRTSSRIGEMVGLIAKIASQTNLLALNATIEAARAGESGRGFAVVAAEVKTLADETAKVTGAITGLIAELQVAMERAVGAIGTITARIGEIDGVTAQVAAAVAQQGAATGEILRSAGEASTGTDAVTNRISAVAEASEETTTAANQVLGAASELSGQSEHLKGAVVRFLSRVRAA